LEGERKTSPKEGRGLFKNDGCTTVFSLGLPDKNTTYPFNALPQAQVI
jgi:hypothetical protein